MGVESSGVASPGCQPIPPPPAVDARTKANQPAGSASAGGNAVGEGRKISCEDIQLVQNLIERCLQLYMNQREVISTLEQSAKIDPPFTSLVWQKLEEQNPDFFRAYYARLKVKRQLMHINQLLEVQRRAMQKHPHAHVHGKGMPTGMPGMPHCPPGIANGIPAPNGMIPNGMPPPLTGMPANGMPSRGMVASGIPAGMPSPGPPPNGMIPNGIPANGMMAPNGMPSGMVSPSLAPNSMPPPGWGGPVHHPPMGYPHGGHPPPAAGVPVPVPVAVPVTLAPNGQPPCMPPMPGGAQPMAMRPSYPHPMQGGPYVNGMMEMPIGVHPHQHPGSMNGVPPPHMGGMSEAVNTDMSIGPLPSSSGMALVPQFPFESVEHPTGAQGDVENHPMEDEFASPHPAADGHTPGGLPALEAGNREESNPELSLLGNLPRNFSLSDLDLHGEDPTGMTRNFSFPDLSAFASSSSGVGLLSSVGGSPPYMNSDSEHDFLRSPLKDMLAGFGEGTDDEDRLMHDTLPPLDFDTSK